MFADLLFLHRENPKEKFLYYAIWFDPSNDNLSPRPTQGEALNFPWHPAFILETSIEGVVLLAFMFFSGYQELKISLRVHSYGKTRMSRN